MNIQGDLQRLQQITGISPTSSAAEKTIATPSSEAAQTATTDQAHLSVAANVVSRSVGAADVRTEKVAAVQAAVSSGSYSVDASAVAGKLIDHMLGGGK